MIELYLKHKVKLKAAVPHLVLCAHCGTEYVYELKRTGHGESESELLSGEEYARAMAYSIATEKLDAALSTGRDPVPCPHCFCYQPHMHMAVQSVQYRWIAILAMLLLVPVMIGTTAALAMWHAPQIRVPALTVTAFCFLLSMTTFWRLARLRSSFDPNQSPLGHRKNVAEKRAMTLDEFNHIVAGRNRMTFFKQPRSADRGLDSPFVLNVWVRQAQLDHREVIPIELPTGTTIRYRLQNAFRHGGVYQLLSPTGAPAEFAIRILVFPPFTGDGISSGYDAVGQQSNGLAPTSGKVVGQPRDKARPWLQPPVPARPENGPPDPT